ncbi:MAG: polyhydroxyalkanoate synthesis regulator DNA-binding domain-containing protein [Candidatus Dormibacteria bacterium]
MATHVLKKYSNRKLYDTRSKRYITLDGVAELLRRGDDVQVVDRGSGDDITAVTLSQVLVDASRQGTQSGDEAGRHRREQLLGAVRASLSLPRELGQRAAGGLAQRVENRVDDVFAVGLRNLNIASVEEVAELTRRVDALGAELEELRRELSQAGSTRSSRRTKQLRESS